MHVAPSSTSSSEVTRHRGGSPVWSVTAWSLAFLVAIDLGVNWAFPPATGSSAPSAMQRYFEYGRSVEGKLTRMVASDPGRGGLILSAGWIDEKILAGLPSRPEPSKDLLVAVYGQSFALNASIEAARLDGGTTIRSVGGPGAPPSHSYAAYKVDAPLRKADVVVLGVLSSSVAAMGSMSGLIWLFENPAPFTFPRYHLTDGKVTEVLPVLKTEHQFRQAFSTQSPLWQSFKDQLRAEDRGYDRTTFDASAADASSIVRLLRRGWMAHRQAYERGVYEPGVGFNPDAEDVRVLKALLVDMAHRTHQRGERFIVLLLHARGQSSYLNQILESTLKERGIEYISSDQFFSANDPSKFVADGHYTEAANRLIARALANKLRSNVPTVARGQ